ncbi:serine protease [Micromonospora zingiberis]|uniref:Serine protease n=2 Tax=Micromonospora zingiberis TaxID=2053011 RepID=A0A4V2LXG0_9ACTN|nr:serine protease [Micromonospora zingiberis]TCC00296.1 serine protease [Micromonospora zingiberis]
MALDERHVLTCAHVVGAAGEPDPHDGLPAWPVDVDLVGQPGVPTVSARVVPGCWAPPTSDGRGDVALLELVTPLPHGPFAPLRRVRPSGRRVVVCGYPDTLEHGVYVRARLAGRSGAGRERVQMDSSTTGPQIIQGFSGAAVTDESTGHVVGMVVSTYGNSDGGQDAVAGHAPASGLSWMIPVETILHYLPRVGDWVSGRPSVDLDFRLPDQTPVDAPSARRIADFFGHRLPANVLVIVTVHPESGTAAAVRRAAVFSSREFRPPSGRDADPDGELAVPPVGSIDLAVEAAGRRTGDVSQQIADWIGATDGPAGDAGHATPPQALIINNIDEADEPEKLLSTVVLPLVDQAPARDLRMLLTFRSESVPLRITLLARRVESLRDVEETARRSYQDVAARVADPPQVPSRATPLRMRLTALRAAAAHDRDSLAAGLASTERATDRALREAEAVRQRLVALQESWSELRGRLDGFLAMAVRHRLAEDPVLSPIYRSAYELLFDGPCELAAAEAAVRRFSDAVLTRIEDQRRGGVG